MAFLTNEKLTIVGAAGMIGSNMAQTALMMGLTSNLCLYDVFSPEGVAEEMRQCGFDGVNITATTDVKEAFTDAKYIISSGGAPRKAGMTREDLLKGNCEIAEQLGKDIKTYCPDVKHVVIIFNPADLTGLVTLLYSGLKPSQVPCGIADEHSGIVELRFSKSRRSIEKGPVTYVKPRLRVGTKCDSLYAFGGITVNLEYIRTVGGIRKQHPRYTAPVQTLCFMRFKHRLHLFYFRGDTYHILCT